MIVFATVVYVTVKLILKAFYYLLFARAVLSWIPVDAGRISDFIYGVTEFVLAPVRSLTDRLFGKVALPIDLSFTVVFIIITVLLYVL